MIEAQGLALAWLVGPQVLQAQRTRARRLRRAGHYRLSDGPFMQGPAALGSQAAQDMGVFGIAQPMANRPGLTLRVVEKACGQRVLAQMRVGLQQGVQARADPEAGLGQRDSRLEQPRPGQGAVLAVGGLKHAHRSRHPYRASALHRFIKGQRFAVVAQQQVGAGGRRGRLSTIKGLHSSAVEVHQESATADAARLRLYQAQHQLHGNRGVQGRTSGTQDLLPGLAGQGVGGRHGLAPEGPAGLVGTAAGSFGQVLLDVAPHNGRGW